MKTYSTSDIALAAALKIKGHLITGLEKEHGNPEFFFTFDDTPSLHASVQQFYNDELTAPCSLYHASLRGLMSMIKSGKRYT